MNYKRRAILTRVTSEIINMSDEEIEKLYLKDIKIVEIKEIKE